MAGASDHPRLRCGAAVAGQRGPLLDNRIARRRDNEIFRRLATDTHDRQRVALPSANGSRSCPSKVQCPAEAQL